MAPDGWRMATIGELGDVLTGGTPSRRREDFWGGDIPWMSSGEIHQKTHQRDQRIHHRCRLGQFERSLDTEGCGDGCTEWSR